MSSKSVWTMLLLGFLAGLLIGAWKHNMQMIVVFAPMFAGGLVLLIWQISSDIRRAERLRMEKMTRDLAEFIKMVLKVVPNTEAQLHHDGSAIEISVYSLDRDGFRGRKPNFVVIISLQGIDCTLKVCIPGRPGMLCFGSSPIEATLKGLLARSASPVHQ